MAAILDLRSMLRMAILFVCTMTHLKNSVPEPVQKNLFMKDEGSFIKRVMYVSVVVGERLSPYVSILCFYFGLNMLISLFI
ncbi:hypothetical protein NEFER03_0017 [Nematocida sp. LUAm3]|nr:hypothetical protein NEFER03_0017 [Nematocida sp. LUAm3]KAI5173500.1 hypothetical protein NEFER02_0016 [Nematocida sp. LUAm2]KAI5176692.1 hypothetical protein NEFER01_0017 [Nematocida sp. LUAm1]